MPYLTAHALDRVNEWLVRARLAGRLPPVTGPPLSDHLEAIGGEIHPDPAMLGALAPRHLTGRRWTAETPWPNAAGNNAVWHAERYAASSRTGSTAPRGVAEGRGLPPAVILLHGWLIDRPQLTIYRSWARRLASQGIEVWMPRLPHHLERTDPGEVSGALALSPDLSTSLDMVRQAVAETRLLGAGIRSRGARRVGIWGMSFGGWVASLAATLDSSWDAVALWAPVADPLEVLFESGLVDVLRSAIAADGISETDFDSPLLAPVIPSRCVPRVARADVLIVAGAYDQVVSPRSVARLARRWNADVRWVPHGHISLMASRAPVRQTVAFLRRALFR